MSGPPAMRVGLAVAFGIAALMTCLSSPRRLLKCEGECSLHAFSARITGTPECAHESDPFFVGSIRRVVLHRACSKLTDRAALNCRFLCQSCDEREIIQT